MTLTEAFDRSAWLAGGRAGLVLGRRVVVGVAGFGGVSTLPDGGWPVPARPTPAFPICIEIYPPPPGCLPYPLTAPEVAWGYGGFEVQVLNQPSRLLHWTAGVLVGGGSAAFRAPRFFERGTSPVGDDVFAVVEPSVGAQLNLFTWMRADLAVSYRFVSGFGGDALGRSFLDGDLAAPAVTLGVRLGRF